MKIIKLINNIFKNLDYMFIEILFYMLILIVAIILFI